MEILRSEFSSTASTRTAASSVVSSLPSKDRARVALPKNVFAPANFIQTSLTRSSKGNLPIQVEGKAVGTALYDK